MRVWGTQVLSLWGLKETEVKEDVVTTCLDVDSDKAKAYLPLAEALLKYPAGQQRQIGRPVRATD